MTNRLLLCFLILMLISCASLKSKQRLVKKGFNSIESKDYIKNGKDYSFTLISNPNMNLTRNILKSISRKQIKLRLSNVEHFLALMPDTTITKENVIDSFYFNASKMSYIEKNKLMTNNIHFLQ